LRRRVDTLVEDEVAEIASAAAFFVPVVLARWRHRANGNQPMGLASFQLHRPDRHQAAPYTMRWNVGSDIVVHA
jgi:hypothetical protein